MLSSVSLCLRSLGWNDIAKIWLQTDKRLKKWRDLQRNVRKRERIKISKIIQICKDRSNETFEEVYFRYVQARHSTIVKIVNRQDFLRTNISFGWKSQMAKPCWNIQSYFLDLKAIFSARDWLRSIPDAFRGGHHSLDSSTLPKSIMGHQSLVSYHLHAKSHPLTSYPVN